MDFEFPLLSCTLPGYHPHYGDPTKMTQTSTPRTPASASSSSSPSGAAEIKQNSQSIKARELIHQAALVAELTEECDRLDNKLKQLTDHLYEAQMELIAATSALKKAAEDL
jgi:uncharacterized coiled-coil protein SlyX